MWLWLSFKRKLFMYVYSCNALSARFFAVDRALNSYFMIMIMIITRVRTIPPTPSIPILPILILNRYRFLYRYRYWKWRTWYRTNRHWKAEYAVCKWLFRPVLILSLLSPVCCCFSQQQASVHARQWAADTCYAIGWPRILLIWQLTAGWLTANATQSRWITAAWPAPC